MATLRRSAVGLEENRRRRRCRRGGGEGRSRRAAPSSSKRSRSRTFPALLIAPARSPSSGVSALKLTSNTIRRGPRREAADQAGMERPRHLVDVASPAQALSRMRWKATFETFRHVAERVDVSLQPADRGAVETNDQGSVRRVQISPGGIEQSEPDLALELLSQLRQRDDRHGNRAKSAQGQTPDHERRIHGGASASHLR